jgi:Protein of unknown function (DUF3592)
MNQTPQPIPAGAPLLTQVLTSVSLRLILAIAAVLLVLAIGCTALSRHERRQEAQLAAHGQTTQAVVEHAFADDSVRVDFRDDHGAWQRVDIKTFGGGVLRKGREVQVRYDPGDPWNARFAGSDAQWNVAADRVRPLAVLFFALFAIVLVLALYRARLLAAAGARGPT